MCLNCIELECLNNVWIICIIFLSCLEICWNSGWVVVVIKCWNNIFWMIVGVLLYLIIDK